MEKQEMKMKCLEMALSLCEGNAKPLSKLSQRKEIETREVLKVADIFEKYIYGQLAYAGMSKST